MLPIAELARMLAENVAIQRYGPEARVAALRIDSVEMEGDEMVVVVGVKVENPLQSINVTFALDALE